MSESNGAYLFLPTLETAKSTIAACGTTAEARLLALTFDEQRRYAEAALAIDRALELYPAGDGDLMRADRSNLEERRDAYRKGTAIPLYAPRGDRAAEPRDRPAVDPVIEAALEPQVGETAELAAARRAAYDRLEFPTGEARLRSALEAIVEAGRGYGSDQARAAYCAEIARAALAAAPALGPQLPAEFRPAIDGERAGLSTELCRIADLVDQERERASCTQGDVMPGALIDPDNPGAVSWFLRRAAALLTRPAAGVSREEVVTLIRSQVETLRVGWDHEKAARMPWTTVTAFAGSVMRAVREEGS